jgi:hypothetical protein
MNISLAASISRWRVSRTGAGGTAIIPIGLACIKHLYQTIV